MAAKPWPWPVLRILDANANRAAEGLRVVEEYARFALEDRHLSGAYKQLRHDLASLLAEIPPQHRLAARETQADIGTTVTTTREYQRDNMAEVVAANQKRVQQSLRCLEEYAKTLDPQLAACLEPLRYRTYTLERALRTTADSLQRLTAAQLYLLLDGAGTPQEFAAQAERLIRAGAHVLQLRDKQLGDRDLLERARLLRQLTRQTTTLLVINDRPDLALLAQADGVHVGQEELAVKDVRTLVGPEMLIGVSTHSLQQARQAVLDGANYLGCGPTFPSSTKQFDHFPGLELLRQVSREIRLPAFAIGGIQPENLAAVLKTGCQRIAVRSAVLNAKDPTAPVKQLLGRLNRADRPR